MDFETRALPGQPDVIAPDGSEIRLLSTSARHGSMVHCKLDPGKVTRAVRHRTVEEMWVCIAGAGELWLSQGGGHQLLPLAKGVSCHIPTGACFQFRTTGDDPLEVIIATMPPWPGETEAAECDGAWKPSL